MSDAVASGAGVEGEGVEGSTHPWHRQAEIRLRAPDALPILFQLYFVLSAQTLIDPHAVFRDIRASGVDDHVKVPLLPVGSDDPAGRDLRNLLANEGDIIPMQALEPSRVHRHPLAPDRCSQQSAHLA